MDTLISRAGLLKLKEELEALSKQKRKLSGEVGRARELGDLRENAEYHAAKERLAQVMGKIGQLQAKVASARIVDNLNLSTDEVRLGMQVVIQDKVGVPINSLFWGVKAKKLKGQKNMTLIQQPKAG